MRRGLARKQKNGDSTVTVALLRFETTHAIAVLYNFCVFSMINALISGSESAHDVTKTNR
jgi:hypothetical protein